MTAVEKARKLFPRGLYQPAGSFRFSADALLLGAFLNPEKGEERLLDLGAGCGIVAFMMLLRHRCLSAAGLDIQQELLEAAAANAENLGLGDRFKAIRADVFDESSLPENEFDIVLTNPPYKNPKQGRLPASVARRRALFEEQGGLAAFAKAAAVALKPAGRAGFILPASRLSDISKACAAAELAVSRIRPIHPRSNEPASLVLVEAAKGRKADANLLPPLIMHGENGEKNTLTREAMAFCPELKCNSGKDLSTPEHMP